MTKSAPFVHESAYVDDGAVIGGGSVASLPANWHIAGTGDFNADGRSDILWQNASTGECSLWLMNGTTFMTGISLGAVPLQWSIANK